MNRVELIALFTALDTVLEIGTIEDARKIVKKVLREAETSKDENKEKP
ncbi:hypothetical protein FACS1894202_13430 [Clostridia bacterium]|nr:hypothetical protein FACS1894202_13430 [Clostridia bacterium]